MPPKNETGWMVSLYSLFQIWEGCFMKCPLKSVYMDLRLFETVYFVKPFFFHFRQPFCEITLNEKAHGLKAQPLKDFILGSSPSVNRKLFTHILTNVNTHPATQNF